MATVCNVKLIGQGELPKGSIFSGRAVLTEIKEGEGRMFATPIKKGESYRFATLEITGRSFLLVKDNEGKYTDVYKLDRGILCRQKPSLGQELLRPGETRDIIEGTWGLPNGSLRVVDEATGKVIEAGLNAMRVFQELTISGRETGKRFFMHDEKVHTGIVQVFLGPDGRMMYATEV
jgi:hypothetical protein